MECYEGSDQDDWDMYDQEQEDEFMLDEMELVKRKSSTKQTGEQDMFSTATKNDLYSMVNASEIFNIQN